MMKYAFTLIEMLLVIAVIAVMSGAAILRLTPGLHRLSLEDGVRRIEELDHIARQRARTQAGEIGLDAEPSGRVRIVIAASAAYAYGEDSAHGKFDLFNLSNLEVTNVRTAAGVENDVINVGWSGATPTYGVRVSSRTEGVRWIIFAGLTGNPLELDDETEEDRTRVESVFTLNKARPQANSDDSH